MSVLKYYKHKLVDGPLTVEYSSEDGKIRIEVEHKLKMGASIWTDHLTIDPSAIKPLIKLLESLEVEEPTHE